jgi:hypothetical protein
MEPKQVTPIPRTSWTAFCLPENTQWTNNNCGSNQCCLLQPPKQMSSNSNKILKIGSNKDKLERLASVLLEKNSMLNVLMNLSDKSPLIVLKEDSCWLESEMKSEWPFKLIRLCMKVVLLMEWGKLCKPNRRRRKWIIRSRILN